MRGRVHSRKHAVLTRRLSAPRVQCQTRQACVHVGVLVYVCVCVCVRVHSIMLFNRQPRVAAVCAR